MLSHARLLGGTVLLLSVLTLSRVQDRPSDCWSVAWLLPVLTSAVLTAGCLASLAQTDSAAEVMHIAVVSLALLNALLMMLYYLRHRRRLAALLRRAADLERVTAAGRRPGELPTVQLQFLLIAALSAMAATTSLVEFFGEELRPPRYPNPVLVPAPLQTPAWYWVIFSLQLVHDLMVTGVNAAIDLLLIGMADTVATLLGRLARQVEEDDFLADQVKTAEDRKLEESSTHENPRRDMSIVGSLVVKSTDNDPYMAHKKGPSRGDEGAVSPLRVRPASVPPAAPSAALGPEHRLRELATTHRAVQRLTADAADFCSPPLFCLYTSITGMLLMSSYINIRAMSSAGAGSVWTYLAYIALMLLRLLNVSCAGSRLTEQGQRLHAALADASWQERQLTPAQLLTLQLLLERSRRPAALHGWGLFNAEKTTVLSILGFVLTYIVILIQMLHV